MNTDKALETKRLVLVPGNNARDDEPFINMLRNDGNFRDFCGIEFSEKYLAEFRNYFERTGHDECIIQYFLKVRTDSLVMWDFTGKETRIMK